MAYLWSVVISLAETTTPYAPDPICFRTSYFASTMNSVPAISNLFFCYTDVVEDEWWTDSEDCSCWGTCDFRGFIVPNRYYYFIIFLNLI